MKITIAQQNPIIGDIVGNCQKVIETINSLNNSSDKNIGNSTNQQQNILFFSELFLTGYSPKDLIFYSEFISQLQQAHQKISECVSEKTHLFIGTIDYSPSPYGECFSNCVFYFNNHSIKKKITKTILANHDVFNEKRYFSSDPSKNYRNNIVNIENKKFLITICEDLWYDSEYHGRKKEIPFLENLDNKNFDVIVNIAASPFTVNKKQQRQKLFQNLFQKNNKPIFYINQIGANDSLIFDGSSFTIDSDKKISLKSFQEQNFSFKIKNDLISFDDAFSDSILIEENKQKVNDEKTKQDKIKEEQFNKNNLYQNIFDKKILLKDDSLKDVYHGLILGIRDYFQKSKFKKALLGISGGIDSALVASLAVKALGSENVLGIAMPSQFNSQQSLKDAKELANNLNIELKKIAIESIYENYLLQLKGHFENLPFNLAEENLQSRIRGTLLMAMSNKHGHLLLNTGNKSELAVGYCTVYGDMNGALSPIGDLYKTQIFQLSQWISDQFQKIIPKNILTKEPSAELRPDQKDSDSLPSYDILDQMIYLFIEEKKSVSEIQKVINCEQEVILKIIDLIQKNEYKRFQSPPILKINEKSFGEGRLIPIVKRG